MYEVLVVLIFTMVMHIAMQYVALSYYHFILGAMELIAFKRLVSKPSTILSGQLRLDFTK